MAKAFAEQERRAIEKRLMEAARDSLGKTGIAKTSVDFLARSAGISKGAFYMFFGTKEELFFKVIMECHEAVEQEFIARLSALANPGDRDISALLFEFYREAARSFFPELLAGGELELLYRRLPPGTISDHEEFDAGFFGLLQAKVPALADLDAGAYAAALRALFLTVLHRKEIGEDRFERALEILVDGTVRAMFAEAGGKK